ncbi:MAG: hypothetical protein PHO02_01215 [Candidatus Nanoarchaeia archaeon]|nr:hypothetical protein [Candidatus Nanoarchaeia archaeon]
MNKKKVCEQSEADPRTPVRKAASIGLALLGLLFLILWFRNLMTHGSMLQTWIFLGAAALCAYLSKRMNKI